MRCIEQVYFLLLMNKEQNLLVVCDDFELLQETVSVLAVYTAVVSGGKAQWQQETMSIVSTDVAVEKVIIGV